MEIQNKISLLTLSFLLSTTSLTMAKSVMTPLTLEQKLDLLIDENNRLKSQLDHLQGQFNDYTTKNDTATKAVPIAAPKLVGRTAADKLKLTIGGQINRVAAFQDTGRRSEFKHLDNNASSTRLTIEASGLVNANIKVGTVIEGEMTGNNTKNHDIGTDAKVSNFSERKLEAYASHAKLGDIWIGQGETAAHRVTDVDLSGTAALIDGGEFESFAGGVKFVKGSAAEPKDRDRTIAQTYTEIFGTSRKNRLKYVTPKYNGFTVEASHAMRDYSDIALRYAGNINTVKIAGAVGYTSSPFNSNGLGIGQSSTKFGRKDYGGGASALFPNGISIGGAYAVRNFAIKHRNKGSSWSTKLGYQRAFFDIGKTFMAFAYGEGKALFESVLPINEPVTSSTFLEDNSEKIKIGGIYFVQAFDAIGTEIYAGYQCHNLSRHAYDKDTGKPMPDYNFKKIHAAMMGARVKF